MYSCFIALVPSGTRISSIFFIYVIADYTMEPHRETRGFNGKLSGKLDGTTMEPL